MSIYYLARKLVLEKTDLPVDMLRGGCSKRVLWQSGAKGYHKDHTTQ